jgi:hypothetical protein
VGRARRNVTRGAADVCPSPPVRRPRTRASPGVHRYVCSNCRRRRGRRELGEGALMAKKKDKKKDKKSKKKDKKKSNKKKKK